LNCFALSRFLKVLSDFIPSVSSQAKWHKVKSPRVLIEKIFVEASLDCDNWILIAPGRVKRRRRKDVDKIEASIGKVMHEVQMALVFFVCHSHCSLDCSPSWSLD